MTIWRSIFPILKIVSSWQHIYLFMIILTSSIVLSRLSWTVVLIQKTLFIKTDFRFVFLTLIPRSLVSNSKLELKFSRKNFKVWIFKFSIFKFNFYLLISNSHVNFQIWAFNFQIQFLNSIFRFNFQIQFSNSILNFNFQI
jgi:hypothetical protein